MSRGKFLKKRKVTVKFLTLEQQIKGPVMSKGQIYIT